MRLIEIQLVDNDGNKSDVWLNPEHIVSLSQRRITPNVCITLVRGSFDTDEPLWDVRARIQRALGGLPEPEPEPEPAPVEPALTLDDEPELTLDEPELTLDDEPELTLGHADVADFLSAESEPEPAEPEEPWVADRNAVPAKYGRPSKIAFATGAWWGRYLKPGRAS